MKILSVIIAFCACIATLGAEEPITPCPLKASASYPYTSLNPNRSVRPGYNITVWISIQNISTNLIVMSLNDSLSYNWQGKPDIVLSTSTNKITGAITKHGGGAGGGGSRTLISPYSGRSGHANAPAYAFIEPGKSFLQAIECKVPENLGDYPFTEIEYSATIEAQDSGKAYGLNAWKGTLNVEGFTVPLWKSNHKNGQPTNAPYSSPAAGSKR